mmetsp:Transcript_118239/g.331144  ORF Transcript_118239/g.331144 Transcript_118239/m.331144 type:complete len:393 (+) Transcript_118239:525-1703(+)
MLNEDPGDDVEHAEHRKRHVCREHYNHHRVDLEEELGNGVPIDAPDDRGIQRVDRHAQASEIPQELLPVRAAGTDFDEVLGHGLDDEDAEGEHDEAKEDNAPDERLQGGGDALHHQAQLLEEAHDADDAQDANEAKDLQELQHGDVPAGCHVPDDLLAPRCEDDENVEQVPHEVRVLPVREALALRTYPQHQLDGEGNGEDIFEALEVPRHLLAEVVDGPVRLPADGGGVREDHDRRRVLEAAVAHDLPEAQPHLPDQRPILLAEAAQPAPPAAERTPPCGTGCRAAGPATGCSAVLPALTLLRQLAGSVPLLALGLGLPNIAPGVVPMIGLRGRPNIGPAGGPSHRLQAAGRGHAARRAGGPGLTVPVQPGNHRRRAQVVDVRHNMGDGGW